MYWIHTSIKYLKRGDKLFEKKRVVKKNVIEVRRLLPTDRHE